MSITIIAREDAPMPLGTMEASKQAMRLRVRGLSYDDIAIVMNVYHGFELPGLHWRRRLRKMGAPAVGRGQPVRRGAAA